MEIPNSNERQPRADHAAASFFRIAIPAWNWGRSMVGLAAAPTAVSRDELQRIFGQDLAFDPRASAGLGRRSKGPGV